MTDTPPPVPDGYVPIFPDGFNAYIGPILGKFDGPEMGPHHFIFDVRPEHLNGGDMMHGGMLMALADVVLGSTVAQSIGGMGSTIALNCDFLAGAQPGTRIEGEATISRKTNSVVFVSGRLFSGDKTLLTASGIWKVLKNPGPKPDFTSDTTEPANDYAKERNLEPLVPPAGYQGRHWKSPRQVEPPGGFILQPLGDPFEAYVGPFFANEGYRTADPAKGEMAFAFQIDERHVNASGICHGGMFLTFADATLGAVPWRASGSHAVTLSLQSQFLKPGKLGDMVFTRPRLTRKTPSIIFCESTFEIEEETVFTATSLWKVIDRKT